MPLSEFAGALRSPVELWRQTEQRLETGISASQWEYVAKGFASVAIGGVGANLEGMVVSAQPRFKVTVRSEMPCAIDQCLRWQGKQLAIRQITPDPLRPDRQQLLCEELRQ